MLLRHSLELEEEADLLDTAVQAAIASGLRTPDLAAAGSETVTTQAMTDAIIAALR